ncbi:MAG TPA: OsmC family protein [Longimicrobiales bacterium]
MLGTLNGALEVRGIRLDPDAIHATATGTNELVDGIVTLRRIDIHYTLRIPPGTRDAVDRALSRHREKCPTARSLAGAVAVEFSADISEGSG